MIRRVGRRLLRPALVAIGLWLVAAVAAPFLRADRFGDRIRLALESALNRRVEIGAVHYSFWRGPGFSVADVVIHEDPRYGIEPSARVGSLTARLAIVPLFTGGLEVASLRLDETSVNLVKRAEGSGRWNFDALVSSRPMGQANRGRLPFVSLRNARINFKSGVRKSVFYLMNADIDVSPEPGSGFRVRFAGEPARTDRAARGFGRLVGGGVLQQSPSGKQIDLSLELERSSLGDITTLLEGYDLGVHGDVSGRMTLRGPISSAQLRGSLSVDGLHRWDLILTKGGHSQVELNGKADLSRQTLEIESSQSRSDAGAVSFRLRAADYLERPRWAVGIQFTRYQVAPLAELARRFGAPLPQGLKLSGLLDGAAGYDDQGDWQGRAALEKVSLQPPNGATVNVDRAALIFTGGELRLEPAEARMGDVERATIEGSYSWQTQALRIGIAAEKLRLAPVEPLLALASVPYLSALRAGELRGALQCDWTPQDGASWSGKWQVENSDVSIEGLASPVRLFSLRAEMQEGKLQVDRVLGQAGGARFEGDFRAESGSKRPQRLRLRIAEADTAALAEFFAPALARSEGLLARTLRIGRAKLPEWMAARHIEGTVQLDSLKAGEQRLENVKARYAWEGAQVEFDAISASIDRTSIRGRATVRLLDGAPGYSGTLEVSGFEWNRARLDGGVIFSGSGIGTPAWRALHAGGSFQSRSLDLPLASEIRSVSGCYRLAWPAGVLRIELPELAFNVDGELFTGSGATRDDGSLAVLLNRGERQMRLSGSMASLQLEARPEHR